MVTVALIGTGELASIFTKAILSNPSHTLTILSRSPKPKLTALGATVKPVDYDSQPSLEAALAGTHTVISTLFTRNAAENTRLHANVLAACKSVGVKRFAPSEFAGAKEVNNVITPYKGKALVWEMVKSSGMEYTAFRCGLFMNYLAYGSPHPRVQQECFDGLHYFPWVVNVAEGTADIPGDGNDKLVLTTAQDVGRFVACALDLETWPEELGMASEVTTYNQVLKYVEEVTGKKVSARYEPKENLERRAREVDQTLVMETMVAQAMLELTKGGWYVEPVLNRMVDFEPQSVRQFLEQWWGEQAKEAAK